MSVELYFTPTSCGFASVAAAVAGGILTDSLSGKTADGRPFVAHEANIRTHQVVKTGEDYYAINPKGNVPCLVVKDASGAVTLTLNEGSAVLQWIADHSAKTEALAGAWGSDKRYRVQNLLNFVASEVHASTGPLWNPALDAEAKARQQAIMHKKFDLIVKQYTPGPFLGGSSDFTIADSYAYIVLSWSGYLGLTLPQELVDFSAAVKALPAVAKAHELVSSSQ